MAYTVEGKLVGPGGQMAQEYNMSCVRNKYTDNKSYTSYLKSPILNKCM